MHRASRCQEFLSFDKRIQYGLGAVNTGKGRAEKSATAVQVDMSASETPTNGLVLFVMRMRAVYVENKWLDKWLDTHKWLDHVRDTHADGLHCCCHACPGVRESVTFMLDQTSRGGVDPELLWNQTCFWSL